MKHTNMLDSIKIFIIIVFLKQKESYAAGGSKCIQQSTFIKNRWDLFMLMKEKFHCFFSTKYALGSIY